MLLLWGCVQAMMQMDINLSISLAPRAGFDILSTLSCLGDTSGGTPCPLALCPAVISPGIAVYLLS